MGRPQVHKPGEPTRRPAPAWSLLFPRVLGHLEETDIGYNDLPTVVWKIRLRSTGGGNRAGQEGKV